MKTKQKHQIKEKISSLNQLFKNKSPREIHNEALLYLKTNQETEALLLLKKNLYQNFFPASYFVLQKFNTPFFFGVFLWHAFLLIFSLFCLIFFILAFQKTNLSKLKQLLFLFVLYLIFFNSIYFIPKNQVSPLESLELKSAPFDKATVNTTVDANTQLFILKKRTKWLRVQNLNKQSGWVKKEEVFQIF